MEGQEKVAVCSVVGVVEDLSGILGAAEDLPGELPGILRVKDDLPLPGSTPSSWRDDGDVRRDEKEESAMLSAGSLGWRRSYQAS